jgi:hypothetical protein
MSNTPWMTSDGIVSAIKRKIALPISELTFSEQDLLDFTYEELLISQVPSILQFNEEYFVTNEEVEIKANKSAYEIPERAIGMKLRNVFYKDNQDNLFEMTQVDSDDKTFFQSTNNSTQTAYKFYLENNHVVLVPDVLDNPPDGSLVFSYFLRPNKLVSTDRAAIIESFQKKITVDNGSITAGDTLTINGVVFTAVVGAPSINEFQIGGSSVLTATNLKNAILINGVVNADNGSPSTAIVTLSYSDRGITISSSNNSSLSIDNCLFLQCDEIPDVFTDNVRMDVLQTRGGHRTISLSIVNDGITSNTICFDEQDIPDNGIEVGDYVCLEYECIIPQIPSDLHVGLVERTCARILASLGDQAGLGMVTAKIDEVNQSQAPLLGSRVAGAPKKILARHSHLRYGKAGFFKRV